MNLNTVYSFAKTGNISNGNRNLRIGYPTGEQYFNGYFDELMIYNRALNNNELEFIYYDLLGNYSYLWSTGDTTTSITVSPEQSTTYTVEISDGVNWCTDTVHVRVLHEIEVDMKVYLQGPYLGTGMIQFLNLFGFIPKEQPYSGSPWNYSGIDTVSQIPNTDIIDWVLVELRNSTDGLYGATENMRASRKAAFMNKNGFIVDTSGNNYLKMLVEDTTLLYPMIYHRNHLPIFSSSEFILVNGVYTYDFTTGPEKVYGGATTCTELSPGVWGMIGGNALPDNQIDNLDKNEAWLLEMGSNGYYNGDLNMNGTVENTDKQNIWAPNAGKGSKVPE
ncbi:MAG: hypothetical protein R2764_12095 [Bacteroidales bacterium]